MSNIYQSHWNPRGARKNWERISVDNKAAQGEIASLCQGNVIDACGWFDENGALKILVADTDQGVRHTYRVKPLTYTFETKRL